MKKPFTLGLTGSTGSGKTTASRMLQQMVIPVFDADAGVHRLMKENEDMKALFFRHFPDSILNNEVNRSVLSQKIAAGILDVRQLEKMIYPYLEEEVKFFFIRHMYEPIAVLDVPLLYESGWDKFCDEVILMTASQDVLRQRVFERPGMTEEKYKALISRQMADEIKKGKADYVIDSGKGMDSVRLELTEIIDGIRNARDCAGY